MSTPINNIVLLFLCLSPSGAFDVDSRFLQEAVGTDPAAPFALSAGLVGSSGEVAVQDENASSGGSGAIIAVVVVLMLLLLCGCFCCCVGGGYYFYKKKNGAQQEAVQKHVAVPYGSDHRRSPPRQQFKDQDYLDEFSTSSHLSFD